MHRPSRRGVVAIAAIAAIGGSATLTTIATAEPAPAQPRLFGISTPLDSVLEPILGTTPLSPVLSNVLGTVTMLQPAQVQQILGSLTSGDIGQLLAAAGTVEQVLAIIDPLTPEQLDAALATLTPQQQQQVKENIQTAKTAQAAAKVPVVAGAPAAKPSTRYRAKISSAKVNSKRTSVAITISCPAAAPRGCLVRITGKLAGATAFSKKDFLLARNSTKKATMKLKSSSTKRLKTKGGKVTLTATTGFVTLGPLNKTATVKAPAKKKSKA